MILKRKISYRQKDHKAYVKRKELEYVLEISDNWRKQSFFMFSSYKGTKLRMFFKPFWNLILLLLVCVHAFGETNMKNKANIFMGVLIGFFVIILFIRPYRCASTNFLLIFQLMHIIAPVCMVSLLIGGMENGILVNKYFSLSIYGIIGIFGFCQLLVVVLCLAFRAKWPMHKKYLRSVVYRHESILEMMQAAYMVITKLRLKKTDAKREDLAEIVTRLTDEYNMAFNEEHPFQYSVLELIDELQDTSVVIDDRKKAQDYHFLANFLQIIDEKKSYL